jgi:hypothetical protein
VLKSFGRHVDSLNYDCPKIVWEVNVCNSCKKRFKPFTFYARKEHWEPLTTTLDKDLEFAIQHGYPSLYFARYAAKLKENGDGVRKGILVPTWKILVYFSKRYTKYMIPQHQQK